jgi:hypothetical protein
VSESPLGKRYPNVGWFSLNDRVELHPATDAWMRGDKYGDIVKLGKKYVHVKMDRSGKTRKVTPGLVLKL